MKHGCSRRNSCSASVFGSAPIAYTTNLISVPMPADADGYGNALILDTTNLDPAYLEYYVVDTNWINNLSYGPPGSILFFFAPDWASTSQGGTGPGATGYFLWSGDTSTNGLFAIYTDQYGSNIYFGGVNNGVATTYASAPISWSSNSWHQIGIEWGARSRIYLDGALAASGRRMSIVPWMGTDTNGFYTNGFFIGSDNQGYEQARGMFWDMVTWTVQYGGWYANSNDWLALSNDLVAWQAALGGSGFGTRMAMETGGGMLAGVGGSGLTMGTGMDDSTLTGNGYLPGIAYETNYADYTNFWLAFETNNSGSTFLLTIQNTQSNLTYNILTNSTLDTNLSDWGTNQTLTATNSVIVVSPFNIGSNALFFDASLVWSTTANGLPDWWQMEYFGNLNQPANGYYDGGTLNNGQAYTNGVDPNIITFQIWATNQYVSMTNVPLWIAIQGGVPAYWAVTLDNTNFGGANWTPYTSSNITANLGTAQGWHTVWVGLRGLPANAQQTWNAVPLYLDFTPPNLEAATTLYGLTNGMTLSGVISLPVGLATPSGQLTTLTLEDFGVPIASSIHVEPFEFPVPIMVLDTSLLSNGVHSISVHAFWSDPGDGTEDGSGAIYEADSTNVTVTVYNEISCPNWMTQFGELGNSMVVSAQSGHTNAEWFLDVYDSQSNYIGTMWGITTDGNIYVVWDLIGPDGTLHTDNTFEFVLTTVFDDPNYASKPLPPSYRVTDPWNGPGDWVVVNQQAWNNMLSSDALDTMADGFSAAAQALGLSTRPDTGGATSYRIRFDDTNNGISDWANFRSALYNDLSRNLFYLGHGGPTGLGWNLASTNCAISAKEIATKLRTIPAGQTNIHKYRFVCLDGCSTATGTLPESFGIIHKENVGAEDYLYASLRPSAFVGWDNDQVAGFFGHAVNLDHVNFFQHFQLEWAQPNGVKQAFLNAKLKYQDVGSISINDLKVFGYWLLGPNQFNN